MNYSHGLCRRDKVHPAYGVWRGMKQRCYDVNRKDYCKYGARGITVCRRWRESFAAFWEDMGPTYTRGLKLDRKNNSRGYSKANCRWVSALESANNRRCTRYVETAEHGRITFSRAIELSGLSWTALVGRVSRGVKPEHILRPAGTFGSGRISTIGRYCK